MNIWYLTIFFLKDRIILFPLIIQGFPHVFMGLYSKLTKEDKLDI